MYVVKDNRIPLMERMMDLGCDLTTVNKVRNFFIISKKYKYCCWTEKGHNGDGTILGVA